MKVDEITSTKSKTCYSRTRWMLLYKMESDSFLLLTRSDTNQTKKTKKKLNDYKQDIKSEEISIMILSLFNISYVTSNFLKQHNKAWNRSLPLPKTLTLGIVKQSNGEIIWVICVDEYVLLLLILYWTFDEPWS